MDTMEKRYVEERDGGYWISNSRVSLESVVSVFLEGYSPETIAVECFPTLSLEQVYGAIAYYLGNRPQVDAYLRQTAREFETFHQSVRDTAFSRKMEQARRQLQLASA